MKARPIDAIPIDELLDNQVWEFDLNEGWYEADQDETWVRPVRSLPVDNLDNRVVATSVTLANGSTLPANISNVSLNLPSVTREFITTSLWVGDRWFHLARYFDPEHETYGPDALAGELGLQKEEVFPIRYDISSVAIGTVDVVKGEIPAEPLQRLSKEERMDLILED